jgi:hypothetical protein
METNKALFNPVPVRFLRPCFWSRRKTAHGGSMWITITSMPSLSKANIRYQLLTRCAALVAELRARVALPEWVRLRGSSVGVLTPSQITLELEILSMSNTLDSSQSCSSRNISTNTRVARLCLSRLYIQLCLYIYKIIDISNSKNIWLNRFAVSRSYSHRRFSVVYSPSRRVETWANSACSPASAPPRRKIRRPRRTNRNHGHHLLTRHRRRRRQQRQGRSHRGKTFPCPASHKRTRRQIFFA